MKLELCQWKVADARRFNLPQFTVPLLLLRLFMTLGHADTVTFRATDCTCAHAYSAGQMRGYGPDEVC